MISARVVVGGANHFHDYYTKCQEIKGHWVGDACKFYGVKIDEEISEAAFEALRTNRHAITGEQITCRYNTVRKETSGKIVSNRRSFYDCVFSAPKSFSVLGVICSDERVKAWNDFSVRYTLKEMERWAARRDHKNPESPVEITGNFIAALYKHDASRALEPNLHDHVIIFNMTRSKDGRSYALEARTLYDRFRYFSAIYRDTLAKQAIDAGCYVECDEFGAPQIGLKEKSLKSISDRFSSRAAIKTYLVEKCEKLVDVPLNNNEKTRIVRDSRGLKKDIFDEKFAKESFSGSRSAILKRFCNLLKNCSDGGLVEEINKEVIEAQKKSLPEEDLKLLNEVQLMIGSEVRKENAYLPSLEDAFKMAVEQCFKTKSVLFDYELFAVVLRKCCGKGVSPDELGGVLKQFTEGESPKIVKIRNELTTVAHLRREQDFIRWVNEGKAVLNESEFIKSFTPRSALSLGQSKAVLEMIHCRDQFKALVVKERREKIVVLPEIVRAHIEDNKQVFILTPSNEARDALRKGGEKNESVAAAQTFLKAESLHTLLLSEAMQQSISKDALVILDEAGLASVEQMHAFLKIASAKEWNVQLCGNLREHASAGTDGALKILLRNTTIHKTLLDTVVAQVSPEAEKRRAQRSKLREFINIRVVETKENQLRSQQINNHRVVRQSIGVGNSLNVKLENHKIIRPF